MAEGHPLPPARSFDVRMLFPGAILGAAAYAVTLAVSLAALALSVAGAGFGQDGAGKLPSNLPVPAGTVPSPWQIFFQLAVQLVAMSQFGALGTSVEASVPFLGTVHGSGSVFAVPLLLTAVAAAVCFFGGRRAGNRRPSGSTAHVWVESAATGAVFCLLVNVAAAVFAIAVPAPMVKISPLSAVSFGSIVVSLVVATLATVAGRASARPGTISARWSPWLRPLWAVSVHFGIFLGVAVPLAVLVLGVQFGWPMTLSTLLWAPTAGLYLLGLGHLSPLARSWGMSSIGSSSSNVAGSDFSFGMGLAQFGLPVWAAWLLVLLAVVVSLATSVFWYLRRNPEPGSGIKQWAELPVAFLAAGLLASWMSTVSGSFDASSLASGNGALTLTPLTGLILAVWGLGIEVSARHAAPRLVSYIPLSIIHRILPQSLHAAPGVGVIPDAGLFGAEAPLERHPAASGDASNARAPHEPAPLHPALAAREPLSARSKRNLVTVLGGAGLVAVLVVGLTVMVNVIKGSNGPDKLVASYLQALEDGQASKALTLADPGLANDQRSLLTDAVYSKAAKRIDGFTILSTKTTDTTATVVAELRQDGRKQQSTFTLHKTNPELLDDHWTMDSAPLGKLTVSSTSPIQKALVDGQETTLAITGSEYGNKGTQFPVFPGEYTIELPPTEKYLTAQKAVVLVSIDNYTGSANLSIEPSEALKTEAAAQADALLATCAKSTDFRPKGCPFGTYSFSTTRNVQWTLTKKPTYKLSGTSGSGWALSTDTSGEAKANYERDASYGFGAADWKPDSTTATISFSATVTAQDNTVHLNYNGY
ncbi:hypothetical protein [Arthrobacter sp. efr-133-TYG-118]|uniref:hypothetical protein n=1 Tax=Arthrobacter sp. efr-133-TYG-118 TaxID=3040279 RepID=UPI00254A90A6|nr:hypothetical protein [Arthrobacter sp. efr-133-TYG-118]